MNLFTPLPGFTRSPAGIERIVLRRLPAVLLGGSLLLGLPSVIARIVPWPGGEADTLVRTATVDIAAVSVLAFHWTAVLTVAITATIVLVMKGPAYVADPYPLPDADRPDPQDSRWPPMSVADSRFPGRSGSVAARETAGSGPLDDRNRRVDSAAPVPDCTRCARLPARAWVRPNTRQPALAAPPPAMGRRTSPKTAAADRQSNLTNRAGSREDSQGPALLTEDRGPAEGVQTHSQTAFGG